MSCTVEWREDGSTVHVEVTGVVDSVTARRVSAAIATHVGIDGVEVVDVDATAATVEPEGHQALAELGKRFSGAGQQLVIRDGVPEEDREAALR